MNDRQLGREIYHTILSIMKNTLNLEELSYREIGREDPRYKTFKKHLMEFTYSSTRNLLSEIEKWGLVENNGKEDLKGGFRDTPGGGSGFVNSNSFNEWLKSING